MLHSSLHVFLSSLTLNLNKPIQETMKLTSLLNEHCPPPKKKCVKLSHFTLDKYAPLLLYMVPNFSSFQSNIKYNILKKRGD